MRVFIVERGQDLQSLARHLARGATLEAASKRDLEALNPHVDFSRLEPGTVLLVPDGAADGEPVGAATFDDFAKDVTKGLEASEARVRDGFARAEAQRKLVDKASKSAAFKRATEREPELAKQAEAAQLEHKAEQARAKEAEKSLSALGKLLKAELAVLGKLAK